MKVSVVGIGRVGLPLAAVISKFNQTVGIDIDPRIVQKVNSGARFSEPYLNAYLRDYGLKASTEFSEIEDSEIIFICVGSQSPGRGYAADRFMSSLRAAAPHLSSRNQLLVITTTLSPLELKTTVIPFMAEEGIERRIQGYCYNPAMIALGKVVKDFESPNYMMIGESNSDAGGRLEAFWRSLIGNGVKIFKGSVLDVAVAKYALNTALVSKISYLSFLTEFCEREGGNVDVISDILKEEPRVAGKKMFKGGLGYGGTCFPVDIEAVRYECQQLGMPVGYPDAITALNDWQVKRSVDLVESFGRKNITMLGVSFKQDTEVVAASQPLEIANGLAADGLSVMVYDPMATEQARGILGNRVAFAADLVEAIRFGDVVFLGVEWSEFKALKGSDFKPGQIVVDPWRVLKDNPPPGTYVPYGMPRAK